MPLPSTTRHYAHPYHEPVRNPAMACGQQAYAHAAAHPRLWRDLHPAPGLVSWLSGLHAWRTVHVRALAGPGPTRRSVPRTQHPGRLTPLNYVHPSHSLRRATPFLALCSALCRRDCGRSLCSENPENTMKNRSLSENSWPAGSRRFISLFCYA